MPLKKKIKTENIFKCIINFRIAATTRQTKLQTTIMALQKQDVAEVENILTDLEANINDFRAVAADLESVRKQIEEFKVGANNK